MILFKKGKELHNWLESQQQQGKLIGFVPTMGALHEGHLSLIQTSMQQSDLTICSLFINPTQFNDPQDFERYPKTLEKDVNMLEEKGCDILFIPDVEEMYPGGVSGAGKTHYDLGYLESILEGKFRPGHYQGVCTIVHKLLEIVRPAHLYLGQKDYQQCLVISRLLDMIGMSGSTRIIICPTLREKSGLAMSSRNLRLSAEELQNATVIFKTLNWIRENLTAANTSTMISDAIKKFENAGLRPEYVAIRNASDLKEWDGISPAIVLVAAWQGDVRLIDNMLTDHKIASE